jgi:hypothetical protein
MLDSHFFALLSFQLLITNYLRLMLILTEKAIIVEIILSFMADMTIVWMFDVALE